MTSSANSTVGISFDVNDFMSGIIQTINSSRSDLFTNPSKIVENLANEQASEGVESRLNTFYRLLGLPATRDTAPLTGSTTKTQLSQYSTLNYIEAGSISIVDNGNADLNSVKLTADKLAAKLVAREEFYRKAPPPSQMLKMIQEPLKITDSILGIPERKASIFPTIVDAATPVYPLQKRTAPAFYDGDFILSGAKNIKLPRPFIENVIYIRTYVFAGGDTSNFQSSILNNLKTFVGASSDLTNDELDKLLKDVGISTDGFFSRLEAELITKLVEALRSCAVEYKQVVSQANEFKSKVKFSPVSSDTPGIKLGNTTEILDKAVAGEIDKSISRISLELENVVKRLAMLPTNKIMEAETNFLADAGLTNLNITSDAFMSDFSSLITFERQSIEERLAAAKQGRQSAINEYNKILEKVQYFTGEGTGISVFEVLCVFLALFTIDIKYLVLLLNKDARDRLLASPYYSFQNNVSNTGVQKKPIFDTGENLSQIETALSVSALSVSSAIENFETRIKENFALADAFFVSTERVAPDSPGVGGNNYVYNTY